MFTCAKALAEASNAEPVSWLPKRTYLLDGGRVVGEFTPGPW